MLAFCHWLELFTQWRVIVRSSLEAYEGGDIQTFWEMEMWRILEWMQLYSIQCVSILIKIRQRV